MNYDDKIKLFEKELNYINDEFIKEFTKYILANLPDYFYEIPASSTGKYHPSYALGEGGLVRHTKAAVRIAMELSNIYEFQGNELNCCISALILHDGCKNGRTGKAGDYTVFKHPLEVVELICDICEETTSEIKLICDLISTHMGKWTYDKFTKKEELRKPETDLEMFVHMCDYLASRKCLEFNFEV